MSGNRLDGAQTARRLQISRQSVYRLLHSGELRAAAFGPVKGFQVWKSSVEDYEQKKIIETDTL